MIVICISDTYESFDRGPARVSPPAGARVVCHGLHAAASLEISRQCAKRTGLDLLHKRNCVGLGLAPVSQLHRRRKCDDSR